MPIDDFVLGLLSSSCEKIFVWFWFVVVCVWVLFWFLLVF